MIHEQLRRQSRNAKLKPPRTQCRKIELVARRFPMARDLARETARRSESAAVAGMIALALGAAAVGAVAIGALAIGRLAVGRLTIKKARFETLEVDELTVRRLRVLEKDGP
jgi:hypothetical protein